jgi:electron transfer flavoprotein beta subunit
MKIAVCLKEVLDARLPLQVEAGTGKVKQTGTLPVTALNPADRVALEIAMQIRDGHPGSRVEAFSVSEASDGDLAGEALVFALARGVDYVERLQKVACPEGAPYTAALLATRFESAKFDLICCGDETLDNASAIVGPLLAEILDLPQVTGVVHVEQCSEKQIVVERGLERGNRELLEMDLPGLISLKSEVIAPRYVSFRKLEEARVHEIPVRTFEFREGKWLLPRWPERSMKVAPRARVKKTFTPDSKISPAERVRMIMGGGMTPTDSKSKSSIVEGDPEFVSEQLYRFLKHHEFV